MSEPGKTKEALELVTEINDETYRALFGEGDATTDFDADLMHMASLEYVSDGVSESIIFLGVGIWDDQDNGVPFDFDTAAYERPFKAHVQLKMATAIRDLGPVGQACGAERTFTVKEVERLVGEAFDAGRLLRNDKADIVSTLTGSKP